MTSLSLEATAWLPRPSQSPLDQMLASAEAVADQLSRSSLLDQPELAESIREELLVGCLPLRRPERCPVGQDLGSSSRKGGALSTHLAIERICDTVDQVDDEVALEASSRPPWRYFANHVFDEEAERVRGNSACNLCVMQRRPADGREPTPSSAIRGRNGPEYRPMTGVGIGQLCGRHRTQMTNESVVHPSLVQPERDRPV